VSNPKVFEFAKEVGLTPLALMDKIREWQIPVKSHMSELEPEVLEQIKVRLSGGKAAEAKPKKATVRKAPAKKVAAAAVEAAPAAAAPAAAKSTVVRRKASKEVEEAEAAAAAKQKAAEASEAAEAPETSVTPAVLSPVAEAPAAVSEPVKKEKPQVAEAPAPAVAKAPKAAKKVEVEAPAAPEEAPAPVAAAPVATAPAAAATPAAAAPAATAAPSAASTLAPRKKEVMVGTSGVASASTPAPSIGRRNIIGRMDLSRVASQAPQRAAERATTSSGTAGGDRGAFNSSTAPRPGGFSGPPRTNQNRNIRAGFVAQAQPDPIAEAAPTRGGFEERKKPKFSVTPAPVAGPSAKEREAEIAISSFNPVEFRKREMVFQPKKKKGSLDRAALKTQLTTAKASKRVLKVNNAMKLSDMAQEMGIKAPQLTKAFMKSGVMANMNTVLDFDTIALVLPELGWEAQNTYKTADSMATDTAFGNLDAERIPRPPVVTVMGHVDHGKTSLLDAIRKTDVVKGEAGGITQHIGAYSVKLEDGHMVTFLDTPGHEAFTAMRARGANATDIAVIVVAADDGMMPQTAEAINHAKAAGVPIIVAVNKIDKPGANVERIKQQLTELEIVPEEWGGTTIFCEVSAIKKTGIKELLENIRLVAELQDLKANPERSGTGIVIEAKVDKGRGPVATLLVKDGTVKVGQYIVAGTIKGRVRSLTNDRGERVQEALPGTPVEVLGLESAPGAGDRFDIVKDEDMANQVSETRAEQAKAVTGPAAKMSLEEIFSKVTRGDVKEMAIVLKADVQGSLEAINGMIQKLANKEVKTRVIHSAVGGVNESDVLLANTAKGIVIGFNVRPDSGAQAQAKRLGVDVRTYTIVYELVDDLKKAMTGMLTPDVVEKVMGRAEVRNVFTVPKAGAIAGSFIVDGKIQRSNMARLVRGGKIVYEGKISSLKRFKDDAKEVASGFECGIGIENFNDVKVGDVIEAFVKEEVARELTLDAGV
jgi:translation initiation factor IF-2